MSTGFANSTLFCYIRVRKKLQENHFAIPKLEAMENYFEPFFVLPIYI